MAQTANKAKDFKKRANMMLHCALLADTLRKQGWIALVTCFSYIFFPLVLCMYISSNDFHIGINGMAIDTGGRNRLLVVSPLIQNRNNLSPLTFSSSLGSLIIFSSFNHIGTATAVKHIHREKENKGLGVLIQQSRS